MFSRTPGKILKLLRNVSGIPAPLCGSGNAAPGPGSARTGFVSVRLPRPGAVMAVGGGEFRDRGGYGGSIPGCLPGGIPGRGARSEGLGLVCPDRYARSGYPESGRGLCPVRQPTALPRAAQEGVAGSRGDGPWPVPGAR
ncbi:hypothetical protein GCM10027162_04940 [Streptomyces incanus]